MKKEILHTNNQQVNERLAPRRKIEASLNEIFEAYKLLGFAELQTGDIKELLCDHECFIFRKMNNDESIVINGLHIHEHKALELIKKPAGYEELVALIKQHLIIHKDHYIEQYEVSGGVVSLIKKHVDKEVEDASCIAKTDEDKRRLEFVRFIKEKGTELWGSDQKIPYQRLGLTRLFDQDGVYGGPYTWNIGYRRFIDNN